MKGKDQSSAKQSKPTINGADTKPNGSAAPTTTKQGLRNPYRPPPQYQHRRDERRSRRGFCCRCYFWTSLIVLVLILIVSVAAISLYLLYRPHLPRFSISSLRIARLNLTSDSDSSSSHLSSLLNLTFSSHNSNSHISFFYDSFSLSCFSGSIFIANGSAPPFISDAKGESVFHSKLTGYEDLEDNSAATLRSNLRKKGGFPLTIQMDTKVMLKMGKFKTKNVDLRVTCEGMKGMLPRGSSPSTASVSDSDCQIRVRIKIWKFRI